LGVFDELKSTSGWQSAAIVAERLGLPTDSTERLLHACAAMSLITKTKDSSGSGMACSSKRF
jgi:DNA-binding IclR family transcriptional regulator